MANTYKNIVITPNIGNTAEPRIQFSGGNTTANTDINLYVYPTSNGTVSFEGSAGQLFSITNDLSGLLFSVADVSGIPSLEVYANGLVSVAPYGGNVVIGNTAELIISSGAGIFANGGLGTAGQMLTSNGSSIYWSTPTVGDITAVTAGNGLTGGGTSGDVTLTVLAGNTQLISNSTGIWANQANFNHNALSNYVADQHVAHTGVTFTAGNGLTGGGDISASRTFNVGAANGITVAADTVGVTQGTGTVVNATGVHVNATYIGTLSANNASFLGGTAAASYQLNSTLAANVATLTSNNSTFSYGKTEGNLNVNSASTALTANNSTNLGGIAAANYARVDTADSFDGVVTFNANVVMTKALSANGGFGTAGQVLTSGAAGNVYWATPTVGDITSVTAGDGLTGGGTSGDVTLNVGAANGITVAADTVGVIQGTGVVVNATGVHVNATYIGTIAPTLTGGGASGTWGINITGTAYSKAESALNVNSALTANNATNLGGVAAASYQTTAGLSANVATLTANNSTNLGGVAAANYARLNSAGNFGARMTANASQAASTSLLNATGLLGGLELTSAGSAGTAGAAFLAFHRPGAYAAYFGLDTDNQFAVGGWSAGAALANMKVGSLGIGQAASGTAGAVTASASYNVGSTVVANTTGTFATHLGGVAATNYARVDAADNFDAVVTFNANVVMTKSLSANGGFGTVGQVLTSGASGNVHWRDPVTRGTAVSPVSPTAVVEFTGIPSWARRITVIYSQVSGTGTGSLRVQLGTSSGYETTGYTVVSSTVAGGADTVSFTTGFSAHFGGDDDAASSRSGMLTIVNISGNIWICSGTLSSYATHSSTVNGAKTLAAALTSLRVNWTSTDTFDAGTINIFYE